MLRNEDFLAPTASFFKTNTMYAIANQREVNVFGPTYMATGSKKGAEMEAEASLVHGAPARTSSRSST